MSKVIWFLVLIIGIAIGGGAVWYWTQSEPAVQSPVSLPRLVPDTLRADAPHPPAKEVTDSTISEMTELQAVDKPQEDDAVEPQVLADAPNLTEGKTQQSFSPQTKADDLEVIEVSSPVSIESTEAQRQQAERSESFKPQIAVLPFKVMGSSYGLGEDAGDILCDAVLSEIDTDRFEIYERLQLVSLMEERGFQASALAGDPAAAMRMGKLAKVQYIVLGNLSRLGNLYHLSGRVVDCKSGRIGKRGAVTFTTINQWAQKVPELVNLLGFRSGSAGDITAAENKPLLAAQQNDLVASVNAAADYAVRIRTQEDKQTYYEGEYITFTVTADKDCFVTLLTVDPAGAMTLLLPNKWQPRAFVPRGQFITIPDTTSGFRFPIQPPHGQTIVKAIATLEPLRLSGVTTKSIEQDGFSSLTANTKAIGIEAASANISQDIDADSLDKLLKPAEWSTDELIIYTAKERDKEQSAEPAVEKAKAQHFDMMPVGDDVNDKILADYKRLTANTLSAPSFFLSKPASIEPPQVKEYLVYDASGNVNRRFKMAGTKGLDDQSEDGVVVPNLTVKSFGLPPTKLRKVQWALKNEYVPGQDLGWEDKYDNICRKKDLPLVGLVDAGVDWDDPRISHASWTNTDEIPGNGIDDDKNGYVDDIKGYNFVTDSPVLCPNPNQFNHGTALVSIMAAKPIGSDADVIGLYPNAKIITAVVMTPQSGQDSWTAEGDVEKVIKGIKYVVDNGAKIVNISFGCYVTFEQLEQINKLGIWDELENKQIMLICAAGNDNINIDEHPVFPASLPRKNVVAVAATDAAGRPGTHYDSDSQQWISFTNYGLKTIDKKTPGTFLLSIFKRNQACLLSGTSYATAIATMQRL